MKLTAVGIKGAKPKDKAYKLSDGAGLYLFVDKAGRKYWRYNFRFDGKHKTLSLGVYHHEPEKGITLKKARELHHKARKLVLEGIDPTYQKKLDKAIRLEKAENSFEVIALEWLNKQRPTWAKSHADNVEGRLRNYVFPCFRDRPVSEITPPELLTMLQEIEKLGFHESAHRVRSVCGQVFRYAIVTGRAERDPSVDLKGALTAVSPTSFAAITDPKEIGGLLRAIYDYSGDIVTKCALRLAPLVFVRPTELRHAEWAEINFETNEWLISGEKMKMKEDHIIPLSEQAIAIITEIQAVTGKGKYLFPSVRSKARPMSENTINSALRRMGYTKEEMTGHGFRAMASTLLNEQGFAEDWIEMQLAHKQRNKVRAAYNRAKYLPQRKAMMQQWADYLDSLQTGGDVVPLFNQS